MSAEQLSAIAGVVLSLILSYIPGLREWFAGRPSDHKRLIVLVLLAAISVAAFGLSCAGVAQVVACTQEGALGLVTSFIAALVANQSAYMVSPEPASVSAAKSARWRNVPATAKPPTAKP